MGSVRCGWTTALLLLAAGCGDDPPDLIRKTIGPAGGLVSSHDDVLTLVFQPGALGSDQEIVIFPSDEPPPVFGPAYRVQPDIALRVDVEVAYAHVLPDDTSTVAVAAIRYDDFTNQEGHWVPLTRLALQVDPAIVRAHDSELSLYYGLVEVGSGAGTGNPNTGNTDPGDTDPGNTDPSDTDPGDTDPTSPTNPTNPTGEGCGDGTPGAGDVCFESMDFPMSGGPIDVTLGDFDGDGALDVATVSEDGSFSVRLGDGSGGLGSEQNVAAGNGASSITAADLDQGSGDDLVITLAASGQALLLQSMGNGSFGPNMVGLSGMGASESLLVDVNHDGRPDIVVANGASGSASYLPFTGTGLGSQASYSTAPVAAPVGMAWGHYNYNDDNANQDVLVFGGGSYAVLPGTGTELANAPLSGQLGTDLRRAQGGDFGGGAPGDAVVADFAEGGVYVLISDGGALTFSSTDFYATGAGAIDVAAADFNGDGDIDFFVANQGDDTATLLTNTGGSSWGDALAFTVGAGPSGIAAGDLNGDGVPDVVVANSTGDSITVLLSDP